MPVLVRSKKAKAVFCDFPGTHAPFLRRCLVLGGADTTLVGDSRHAGRETIPDDLDGVPVVSVDPVHVDLWRERVVNALHRCDGPTDDRKRDFLYRLGPHAARRPTLGFFTSTERYEQTIYSASRTWMHAWRMYYVARADVRIYADEMPAERRTLKLEPTLIHGRPI